MAGVIKQKVEKQYISGDGKILITLISTVTDVDPTTYTTFVDIRETMTSALVPGAVSKTSLIRVPLEDFVKASDMIVRRARKLADPSYIVDMAATQGIEELKKIGTDTLTSHEIAMLKVGASAMLGLLQASGDVTESGL